MDLIFVFALKQKEQSRAQETDHNEHPAVDCACQPCLVQQPSQRRGCQQLAGEGGSNPTANHSQSQQASQEDHQHGAESASQQPHHNKHVDRHFNELAHL